MWFCVVWDYFIDIQRVTPPLTLGGTKKFSFVVILLYFLFNLRNQSARVALVCLRAPCHLQNVIH